jgi:hypothetical protein
MLALVTLVMLSVRRRLTIRVRGWEEALAARFFGSYRLLGSAALHIAVATFAPLSLLLLFALVQAFTRQQGPSLTFVAQMLMLWTGVAFLASLAREVFLSPLVPAPHGAALLRFSRLLVLYVAAGLVVLWGGQVLRLPSDVLALVRFLLVLTVGGSVFLLWSRKEAILSLFPPLPNRLYQRFCEAFSRAYHPILFFTFTTVLLWGFGYHDLALFLWQRSWAVAAVFLAAVLLHHLFLRWVNQRILVAPTPSDAALAFHRALVATATYGVTVVGILLALGLMGLLSFLLHLLSPPLLTIGTTRVSGLVMVQAGLVFLAFFLLAPAIPATPERL